MNVSELIEILKEVDQDLEVKFAYNYGDHWRTQVAQDVKKVDDEGVVAYSDYHRLDKVIDPNDEGPAEAGKRVVILS